MHEFYQAIRRSEGEEDEGVGKLFTIKPTHAFIQTLSSFASEKLDDR